MHDLGEDVWLGVVVLSEEGVVVRPEHVLPELGNKKYFVGIF